MSDTLLNVKKLWAQTHIRWSDAPKHVFTVALWPRCARGWAGRGWTAAGVCWSTWSDRGSCWRRRVRSPPAGRRWWSTSESSRPSRSSSGPPDTRPDCRPGWALTRQHTSVMDLTHCTKYLDTPELSHPPQTHTHGFKSALSKLTLLWFMNALEYRPEDYCI